MTPKRFIIILFSQWLVFALLKAWFFDSRIFSNPGVQQVVYWLLTAVIVAVLVRRFEHINFLEAFIVVCTWTFVNLLLDLIFLSLHTGLSIFSSPEYWWGFVVMDVSIIFLHKKKHIKVRHDLHARH
jgi:hypothetical protein